MRNFSKQYWRMWSMSMCHLCMRHMSTHHFETRASETTACDTLACDLGICDIWACNIQVCGTCGRAIWATLYYSTQAQVTYEYARLEHAKTCMRLMRMQYFIECNTFACHICVCDTSASESLECDICTSMICYAYNICEGNTYSGTACSSPYEHVRLEHVTYKHATLWNVAYEHAKH